MTGADSSDAEGDAAALDMARVVRWTAKRAGGALATVEDSISATCHYSLRAEMSAVEGTREGHCSGVAVEVVGAASLETGRVHHWVERTGVEVAIDRSQSHADWGPWCCNKVVKLGTTDCVQETWAELRSYKVCRSVESWRKKTKNLSLRLC